MTLFLQKNIGLTFLVNFLEITKISTLLYVCYVSIAIHNDFLLNKLYPHLCELQNGMLKVHVVGK